MAEEAGLEAPSGPHSEINTDLVDEALRQIDEGKIDTEISSSLGFQQERYDKLEISIIAPGLAGDGVIINYQQII